MTSPCTRCGQSIEAAFLEGGRCLGCRREFKRLESLQKWTLWERSQFRERKAQFRAGKVKRRPDGKFA